MGHTIFLHLLLWWCGSHLGFVDAGYSYLDAANLESSLTTGYNTAFRPAIKTAVDVQLGLMHISELNMVAQELVVGGFLMMKWEDTRLVWIAKNFGWIDEIAMFHTRIWTPPLLLSNAGNGIKMLNDDANFGSVILKVFVGGYVVWLYPINFNAQCSVNIRFYPFDYQECTMTVSTWMYSVDELYLYTLVDKVNLDLYEENGEWDIHSTSVANSTKLLYTYDMSALNYKIRLIRKYSYYVLHLILPVIILACMGPFMFILPVESGEKNGFALTIMLSLSVVMTMVSQFIPTTATNVCILSVYLLMTFIICALETLMTVITCRIHDFHNKGYKPKSYNQALLRALATITFYSRADSEDDNEDAVKYINTKTEGSTDKRMGIKDVAWEEKDNDAPTAIISDYTYEDRADSEDDNEDAVKYINTKTEGSTDKRMGIKDVAWEEKDNDPPTAIINDYTYEEYAVLIDRLNFALFSITTLICTLSFMLYIAHGDSFST